MAIIGVVGLLAWTLVQRGPETPAPIAPGADAVAAAAIEPTPAEPAAAAPLETLAATPPAGHNSEMLEYVAPPDVPAVAPVDPATDAADAAPPEAVPVAPPPPPGSLLDEAQVVVFYGSPIHRDLGILGAYAPEEAAARVKEQAGVYDAINGDLGAVGALDLIYAQAQAEATGNGLYLLYLDDPTVRQFIDLAERNDVQLILDLHIGRGSVVDEVRKIEPYLRHPRVHVAIDPEWAVGPFGVPLQTAGVISGGEINAVQDYIGELVARENLPPKMLIIHQYMDDTVVEGGLTREVPNVDLVLNMDAFGAIHEKQAKYEAFSARPYAQRHAYNVFLQLDDRILSEQEVLDLAPRPHVIFYQ